MIRKVNHAKVYSRDSQDDVLVFKFPVVIETHTWGVSFEGENGITLRTWDTIRSVVGLDS